MPRTRNLFCINLDYACINQYDSVSTVTMPLSNPHSAEAQRAPRGDLDIFAAAGSGSLFLLKDLVAKGQPLDARDAGLSHTMY